MLYGYGLFLLIFFFVSRFMQPNYLGYILGLLSLAVLIDSDDQASSVHPTNSPKENSMLK